MNYYGALRQNRGWEILNKNEQEKNFAIILTITNKRIINETKRNK